MSHFKLPNGFWRTQFRQWHWISSAICLTGLLLFAATGFTLNHASSFEAKPKTTRIEKTLPADALSALATARDKTPLPAPVVTAVQKQTGIDLTGKPADVSQDEVYVDLATPGIDASVTIDPASGDVTYERTTRGVIAILNDLHKGRHAGPVWTLFIDVIALACVLFAITGFGLLWVYEKNRRITWPLVLGGIALPLVLYLLFVHA
jgi:hypothetical protein